MKKKRNFLLFFLMLVATMSALRYLSAGDQGNRKAVKLSASVPSPGQQRTRERVFKQVAASRRFCATETEPGKPLFGPLRAYLDAKRNLYVMDFGDLGIKQFSPEGRFVRTFGRGKGQGPGEFMSVTDFRVLPNGDLWVADFLGGKIEIFSPDGGLRRTVRLERQPFRLVPRSKGGFTLMLPLLSERLFAHFGADFKPQTEFGKLLDDRLDGLSLDGWIGAAGDDSLLYIPAYFGWIASYSPAGELKYLVQTMDPIPAPTIHRNNGEIWVDPDARVSAKSAWVGEGKLYLLSGNDAGTRFSRVIDVYDAATGAYRHSFQAPEGGSGAVVQGGLLLMVKDTSVCAWTFQPAAQTARTAR